MGNFGHLLPVRGHANENLGERLYSGTLSHGFATLEVVDRTLINAIPAENGNDILLAMVVTRNLRQDGNSELFAKLTPLGEP